MANIQVYRFGDGKVESREADVSVLGKRPHRRVMREAVIMYEANRRAGTRRSPLWRGGGTIFGPRPRDYSYGMPRKALRAAVRSALLGKFLDGEVKAMDGVSLDKPSTKRIVAALGALEIAGSVLMILPERDDVFFRSARNIEGAGIRTAAEVNAYDLLAHRNVVLVNGALDPLMKAVGTSRAAGGKEPR